MDDAEILIPDYENLVAQADLLVSSCIEYDENGFHITPKGYTAVWNYLKKLPPAKRLLFCLFFEYTSNVD